MSETPSRARLALGTAALGRPGYMTLGHGDDHAPDRSREGLRARAHAVLDAAHALGVRHVDAARSYGDAEPFVRGWLDARGLAPGAVTVSSKWGYTYTAGWRVDAAVHETKDHGVAILRRQLAESRAILGPHLALYQIHSATLETGVLDDAAVLDELARLRASGVRVGLSVTGPAQAAVVRKALEVRRDGEPLFASVQATWNVLERSCEPALREARQAGREVIVKEALANGRLSPRGPEGQRGPLADLARARGVGPDALALAAALAQPWASLVLLGPSTVAQLASNARARDLVLAPAELAALESLAVPAAAYWSERSRLPWT